MDNVERERSADGFEAEISDLRQPRATATPWSRSPLEPHLSPRQRMWRIIVATGAVTLGLLVILASAPTLRGGFSGWLAGFAPASTPTLAPGSDRVYIEAGGPWMEVSLDGRPLRLPPMSVAPPLVLSRGLHQFEWRAAPFRTQRCTVSVPPVYRDDMCPAFPMWLASSGAAHPARLVLLRESLATLPGDKRLALVRAMQAALSGFSETVQPGEPFFLIGNTRATPPLHATLKFQMDVDTSTARDQSCLVDIHLALPDSCAVTLESCRQLCTLVSPPQQATAQTSAPFTWLVFAFTRLSRDYTTEDGQIVASDQPIDAGAVGYEPLPVLFQLTWDGAAWHAQPLFGPALRAIIGADANPSTSNAACAAAQDLFTGALQPADFSQTRYLSGPNPAAGCLVAASVSSLAGTPLPSIQEAYFFERFGVFLAANDVAHRLAPQLPVAGAYVQHLARQLDAQASGP